MTKSIKGQLSQDDIHYLNSMNANLLSRMFETEVTNICDLPVVNGKVYVDRPAYDDTIMITESERKMAAEAIAYSTLNQAAAQLKQSTGNLIKLYVVGFTDVQIENSGANYHMVMNKVTPNVYRILD